ncbi:MAG: Uma2 family endonuclease [Leptolyngbyaceae cyanobacterium MO_188.B28]|nr:Uma2 family endonuclease [Leptolyngbyaceae cyanobacterium MO_188.B28]
MTQAKPKPIEPDSAKWTLERYHDAIASGVISDWNVELFEGVITPVSPEKPIHWYRGDQAARYIEKLVGEQALVRFNSPITLSTTERNPDIAIVKPLGEEYASRHPGPDDILLLVEVAESRPERDLKDKMAIYARAGIQDYWVLDLPSSQLVVHRSPEDHLYNSVVNFTEGTIKPLLLDVDILVGRLLGR